MPSHYVRTMLAVAALLLPVAAHAQFADLPERDPTLPYPQAPGSAVTHSRAQNLDPSGGTRQMSLEFQNGVDLLRTMSPPAAPQIVRCDPRTLPGARDENRINPNEVVLGRPGQALVTGNIYFTATSDGTQCPNIGNSRPLAPYFNEVQH